jgi:hypothetical protein
MAPHSDRQDTVRSPYFQLLCNRRKTRTGCDRIETLDRVLKALAHRQGILTPRDGKAGAAPLMPK